MNLPNKLTLLRICLIPVFVILMLSKVSNFFLISCIIFIIASITDFLDGKIARKYNLVTDFGKFMDPLADKLLVLSALICMIEYDLVAGWMVIIIVARELTVSILRAIAADNGKVIAASGGGKIKTTSQMIAIILLLIGANYSNSQIVFVGTIAMYIATIFTLYSGIDYLYKNRELFMNSK
ncbi:MAG: CDP-diacylglycerol--glycerol-3-phosphate 3-phosphatidyltransferase [Clostridiales bacterium]|uniref:CDP-diacylglycerol--glycerol-3-phosphate 3-phosphatidyltransferase n=1 Tax=Intestinibacter bartlettii TaxID=261299 RepID=UPI000664A70D|nr:CDP-diacylglycerol--glycerol-3-phosphate 3-phosphatidyltransferase [Intestinibacter bartlettii]KMW26535.1 CDP-diacylglycerol-glycerol-3-phosphate 3-phosphatidyltransferase [Clostridium sp. 1_1_41A1FAA]MDU5920156.1 CDP-diacylglycerol--glycerol-3-phosphate 3-phosphatidyltransferase [Clostridiales bacterium]SCI37028.1 CDP-diacylglycerol--glycerol-3-phosphate 3-phosphatidyltransferase [uncultured Clostridium sp.]